MVEARTRSAARPVLAPAWRGRAAIVAAACALAVLAFGLAVHGQRSGTAVDDALDAAVTRHIPAGTLDAAVRLTDPAVVVTALAVLAVLAVARRQWPLLAVTIAAPALALLLTEVVLKPLVHRTQQGLLAYPSGHESAPACLATILALLALGASWRAAVKVAAVLVLSLYLAVCAVALVGAMYHYATDTVGAVLLSVACVLATALLADRQLT